MKKIINETGFRTAMRSGKTWTTLDCQLSEIAENCWYYEIDKHVFTGSPEEGVIGKGDASWEQLACGEDNDRLAVVGKIWENLIERYNPDEYFVGQDNCAEENPDGEWDHLSAREKNEYWAEVSDDGVVYRCSSPE
jgi:hypothetical protein